MKPDYVLYLNSIDNDYSLNKKNYLLRAAQRLGWDWIQDYKPEHGNPEYILNIEPYMFVQGTKWTGLWEIDLLLDHDKMTQGNWSRADTIFTAISTVPERLRHFKTQLLFQAADSLHKKLPLTPQYDVVLAGTLDSPPYDERRRVYDLLKDKFNVGIRGTTRFPRYIETFNLAKVQFIRSMQTPTGSGELAQRFFECLPIGPVLTNYVDDLRYTGLVEGEDYFSYKTDHEMIEKLNFLLDNPDDAQRIAFNGRQKGLKYHTYEHRLMIICNQIPKNI